MDWNKTSVNISELKGSSVMKKILFFVDNVGEGGVSKVLLDILENLDYTKYEVTVRTLYGGGPYESHIKKYAKYESCFIIPAYEDTSLRSQLYRKYWGGMLRLPETIFYRCFIREKYDIEIAFVQGWSTKFISGSNNKKSKKLAWVHIDLINWNMADGVFRDLEHHKKAYQKYDKVLCVSEAVKESMEKKYEIFNNSVIYNPINKNKIREASKEEAKFNFSKNSVNIISIGRLGYQKGYDRLINICNKLNQENLNFNLLIIGDGDEKQNLQQLIDKYSLKDSVHLVGFKENPYSYLKAADLFVCSSRGEGFSLVVAEAMTLGIPILTVNCSGPEELSNKGEFAMLVENTDQALFEGLKEMIINDDLRTHYAQMANKGASQFSLKNFMEKLQLIFDEN